MMNVTLSRRTISFLAILAAIVLFFALNITASIWLRSAKLDLTEGGIYTVSTGTVSTLRNIPEPVTLRYFFSERAAARYPTLRSYGARVRDLLQEYAAIADGKIKLEVVDPEAFSPAEDEAVAAGIKGAQVGTGDLIYFGLVGSNTIDGRELIPLFTEEREQFLEYDLTAMIHRLTRAKKPIVGVVSNLPLDTGLGGMEAAMQGRSQPFIIYEQLRSEYDMRFLEQDFDRIATDIDVLMIAHPRKLNERTLYAIDQFVMRGGRVLAFLDPFSELGQIEAARSANQQATLTSADSLGPVLKSWGVEIDPKFFIGDRERAQRVRTGAEGQDVSDYIAWVALRAEDIDQKDRITARMADLNLGTAGAIQPLENKTTTVTPLARSSADAMEVPISDVASNPNPDDLLRKFVRSGEQYTFAARIGGPVKSAFPAGPPAQPKPVEVAAAPQPLPAHLKETKGAANIVLVADADIFTDTFWVGIQEVAGQRIPVPIARNGAFVVNAVEDLSGSNELISLRSRGDGARPFVVVDNLRRKAEQRFLREKQRLEQQLEESATKLAALEGRRPDREEVRGEQSQTFTPEQQTEIEKFRRESARIKRQLRDVQLKLNQDIDGLKSWIAGLNIALVPFLMLGAWVLWLLFRARKESVTEVPPLAAGEGA